MRGAVHTFLFKSNSYFNYCYFANYVTGFNFFHLFSSTLSQIYFSNVLSVLSSYCNAH